MTATVPAAKPSAWKITEASEADGVVDAWLTFETETARGLGHLRLKNGKCWTLLTTMTELKGFEEKRGASRESGVAHGALENRETRIENRRRENAEFGEDGSVLFMKYLRRGSGYYIDVGASQLIHLG